MDYFLEGQAKGNVAAMLMNNDFTPGYMRPYVDKNGSVKVTNAHGQAVEVKNADATLRKDEWIHLDRAVVAAARQRLGFVNNLRSAGLVYNLGNGLGKTVLQTQTSSRRGEAKVSMDGIAKGDSDRTEFGLNSLPLPIIHEDFHFTAREIATSRNDGTPLDTEAVTQATTNVAETIERLHLGNNASNTFGGQSIYGLENFPSAVSTTITDPTDAGWTGSQLVDDVLAMKEAARQKLQYGPFDLYFNANWDKFLDADYSDNKGDNTIRERIQRITGIERVETLDFLTNGAGDYNAYLVQRSTSTVRSVQGLDIMTMRWESEGGMLLNFKVMGIIIPQFRADFDGNTGVVHGAPA